MQPFKLQSRSDQSRSLEQEGPEEEPGAKLMSGTQHPQQAGKHLQTPRCLLPRSRLRKHLQWMASFAFCYCDKTLTKSNSRKEVFISADNLHSIIEGSPGRNWSKDHGGVMLTSLFPMAFLAYFLIKPMPTGTGVATPHQSLINKMPHKTREGEAGRFLWLSGPGWSTHQVPSQPELHCEFMSFFFRYIFYVNK